MSTMMVTIAKMMQQNQEDHRDSNEVRHTNLVHRRYKRNGRVEACILFTLDTKFIEF